MKPFSREIQSYRLVKKPYKTFKPFCVPTRAVELACTDRQKPHVVVDGTEYKHCPKCDKLKTLDEYAYMEETWDNRQGYCKACASDYMHKYHLENRRAHRKNRRR